MKNKKHPSEDVTMFETSIKAELEVISEIALMLWPYGGRVRARILNAAKELLDYSESTD